MLEQLMEILEEIRPDVDFENEKQLITDGILDSFDIVSLVGALNDEFDLEIQVGDLVPDNFNSTEGMIALIEKLQDED
ncbi:MAG: acyl carrier protein [Clostridia bacterium]|nr:acyl carrier protein [Ruminococcus sp.]MBQ7071358.1 acyl carrier protein [Ruminococcus sp.]MBQ9460569.1 acyl carrier protein [Clostridia bacterium]